MLGYQCGSGLATFFRETPVSEAAKRGGNRGGAKAGVTKMLMCGQITPAASVASKHSTVLVHPPACLGYVKHCNAIFSLAKNGIFKKEESTPKDGLSLEIDGVMRKFPKDCAQYSCAYDARIVDIVANDATYCTPFGNFPANKKQKTAAK